MLEEDEPPRETFKAPGGATSKWRQSVKTLRGSSSGARVGEYGRHTARAESAQTRHALFGSARHVDEGLLLGEGRDDVGTRDDEGCE